MIIIFKSLALTLICYSYLTFVRYFAGKEVISKDKHIIKKIIKPKVETSSSNSKTTSVSNAVTKQHLIYNETSVIVFGEIQTLYYLVQLFKSNMGIRFGKKAQCCNGLVTFLFIVLRLASVAAFVYFVCPEIFSLGKMTFHELPKGQNMLTHLNHHKSWVNMVVCWVTWLAIVIILSVSFIALLAYVIVLSFCGCGRMVKQDWKNVKAWLFRSIGEFVLGSSRHMVSHNFNYMDN